MSRFVDKLVQRGYATVCDCLHTHRAELYHVRRHALYRAIDQPHSRYRRPVPARHVIAAALPYGRARCGISTLDSRRRVAIR